MGSMDQGSDESGGDGVRTMAMRKVEREQGKRQERREEEGEVGGRGE